MANVIRMDTEPYAKLVEEVRAQRARLEWSIDRLAQESDIAAHTLYRRFANPESFTLGEFIAIATALGLDYSINLDEIEVVSPRVGI